MQLCAMGEAGVAPLHSLRAASAKDGNEAAVAVAVRKHVSIPAQQSRPQRIHLTQAGHFKVVHHAKIIQELS